MPVPIEAYREPRFVSYKDRYPMSYDSKAPYRNTIAQGHVSIRYNGDPGRGDGWKQAGYNVNHNSTRTETVRPRQGEVNSLKPY